jgi:hypothetical protein
MYNYFALNTPQLDVDPDINSIFMWIMIPLLIAFVALIIVAFTNYFRKQRAKKRIANNEIWFDEKEALLNRGSRQLKIPENTIEFYICKQVFLQKSNYHLDLNILEESGGDTFKQRPVYQAVMRLNKKAKSDLGLDDLFIRGKEKTALNVKYR